MQASDAFAKLSLTDGREEDQFASASRSNTRTAAEFRSTVNLGPNDPVYIQIVYPDQNHQAFAEFQEAHRTFLTTWKPGAKEVVIKKEDELNVKNFKDFIFRCFFLIKPDALILPDKFKEY